MHITRGVCEVINVFVIVQHNLMFHYFCLARFIEVFIRLPPNSYITIKYILFRCLNLNDDASC